jgi:hypothetical protein
MTKGWFVGDFTPTLYPTQDVEVAVKSYKPGDCEERHYHKIATEITVISYGEVEMNGQRFSDGDIIVLAPNESSDFRVIRPTMTTVVKVPGAINDKYLGDQS